MNWFSSLSIINYELQTRHSREKNSKGKNFCVARKNPITCSIMCCLAGARRSFMDRFLAQPAVVTVTLALFPFMLPALIICSMRGVIKRLEVAMESDFCSDGSSHHSYCCILSHTHLKRFFVHDNIELSFVSSLSLVKYNKYSNSLAYSCRLLPQRT